jgi:hypothetical protein
VTAGGVDVLIPTAKALSVGDEFFVQRVDAIFYASGGGPGSRVYD